MRKIDASEMVVGNTYRFTEQDRTQGKVNIPGKTFAAIYVGPHEGRSDMIDYRTPDDDTDTRRPIQLSAIKHVAIH